MAALLILLGLCIGKPPEATRLATSPAFGRPRDAFSYMPRKQQRVRVLSVRAGTTPAAHACPRGSKATISPRETGGLTRFFRAPSPERVRPRPEKVSKPHPLRC